MMTLDTISDARRQLLERFRRGELQASNAFEPLIPRPPAAQGPLSPDLEQLWFHDRLADGAPINNESFTIHKRGALDPAVLERCFHEIARRHEIWRSSFPMIDGKVIQCIESNARIPLPLFDLTHLGEKEREAEAVRIATEDARRPFDLNVAPLFRVCLVRVTNDYHRIYLTVHRLVFDCASIERVLISELVALYSAYSAGQPSPFSELSYQYSDYAAWKQCGMAGDRHAAQQEYWRQNLAGDLAPLELPTDRPRSATPTWRSEMETFHIPAEINQSLQELATREGVTPYMIVLAVFQVLLYRYSDQEEIVIGGKTNTRTRPEFEPLIGSFVNTIVFRTLIEPEVSFREFLGRVKGNVLGALAHSDLPFDDIVQELAPKRDPSRHPLFQVLFSMRAPFPDFPDGWELTDMEIHSGASGFDLFVEFAEHAEDWAGRMVYSTDLFNRDSILRMLGHFDVLLRQLVNNPAQIVSRVPFLTDEERHTLLVEWNDTARDFPDLRIHELFEAQVKRSPDHPALVFRGQQLTYAQLNARANQLARLLRQDGATNGSLIGICMERSLEMVVAVFAILKSGGAYVPYDPELPVSRLNVMLQDSRPVCVITQRKYTKNLACYSGPTILLDPSWEDVDRQPASNLGIPVGPKDAIYGIYTSGSTGVPKAAINTHEAVANRILWMQDRLQFQPEDRMLQKTPYSFDVSVGEFFGPLTCGATLVIAEPNGHRDASYLVDVIDRERITTIHFVPSMLREFLDAADLARCGSIKHVFSSGEALSPDLRQKFHQRLGAELHNLYGPTEAAVEVTYWDCRDNAPGTSVPIGRPISNVKAYVLDRYLSPVPIGVAGELYLGGIALARGYLNRPELTAERFIPDPFEQRPEARLYKTGDRARFLADGNIEYLGRLDNQVKLRGFRIELGDIEATLLENQQVRAAAITLHDDGNYGQQLVSYVIPSGTELDTTALRTFLRERLPEYMVPASFVPVDSLPTTSSGKLDRKALPARRLGPDPHREFVLPSDEIEERLANLWQEVLGVPQISVTDNYFDLGGHSSLALRLFSQVKFCFQIELPLATLFYAPTVRSMAGIIRDSAVRRAASPIVPIQAKGAKPPIFCIGALNGEVILFRSLALELGLDQPLYGLQPFGLASRHSTVETLAAAYIEELREWGEHRPFCLVGYSFGGLVALEMAQQLRKKGAAPAVVVLIDSSNLVACKALEPWRDRLQRYWYHAKHLARGVQGLGHLGERIRTRSFRVIHKVSTSLGVGLSKTASDVVARQLRAAENYNAKRYPRRVYLLKAETQSEFFDNPELGWGGVLTDLRMEEVPGDHGTINTGANLKILARKLTSFLEDASAPQE